MKFFAFKVLLITDLQKTIDINLVGCSKYQGLSIKLILEGVTKRWVEDF